MMLRMRIASIISTIFLAEAVLATPCFSHDGIEALASKYYSGLPLQECRDGGNRVCCLNGQQCGSDLLCTDENGNKFRQYCADRNWGPGCSQLCPELDAAGAPLTICGNNTYCCGAGNTDCCKAGNATAIDPETGRILRKGTVNSGTVPALWIAETPEPSRPATGTALSEASPTETQAAGTSAEADSSPTSTQEGTTSAEPAQVGGGGGLSTGAGVGVGVGVTAGLVLVAGLGLLFIRERRKRKALEGGATGATPQMPPVEASEYNYDHQAGYPYYPDIKEAPANGFNDRERAEMPTGYYPPAQKTNPYELDGSTPNSPPVDRPLPAVPNESQENTPR